MDLKDPDAALMVAFQKGDQTAFEQLLDKYHRIIVNFIYRIVNNPSEAEELAQEVFLRICRARNTYEPRAPFAAWIYRIAVNLSLKAAGRARRFAPEPSTSRLHQDSMGGEIVSAVDPMPDAERRLVHLETAKIVRNAIQSLPKKERIALVLRRYEGMSYREIAEAMDCTEAAVKTYIHRGKMHVRDRLIPYLKGGLI